MNCSAYKDDYCLKFRCECVLLNDLLLGGCADIEPPLGKRKNYSLFNEEY